MKKVLNYRKEKEEWEEVECDIDFTKLEPISTSNSFHLIEEKYEVDGTQYRLLYSIPFGGPLIEKLIK